MQEFENRHAPQRLNNSPYDASLSAGLEVLDARIAAITTLSRVPDWAGSEALLFLQRDLEGVYLARLLEDLNLQCEPLGLECKEAFFSKRGVTPVIRVALTVPGEVVTVGEDKEEPLFTVQEQRREKGWAITNIGLQMKGMLDEDASEEGKYEVFPENHPVCLLIHKPSSPVSPAAITVVYSEEAFADAFDRMLQKLRGERKRYTYLFDELLMDTIRPVLKSYSAWLGEREKILIDPKSVETEGNKVSFTAFIPESESEYMTVRVEVEFMRKDGVLETVPLIRNDYPLEHGLRLPDRVLLHS